MLPLNLVIEQLWRPALEGGDLRVVVDPDPDPGWVEEEAYWMFPTAARATLLLPHGPRAVTAASATNYRGLRRPPKNAGRTTLGALARAGLPLSANRLSVQVRADRPEARERLPLPQLARALGVERLYAATGVRVGANRKATLHLLSVTGEPLGYAKFAWNDVTDEFVRTESAALRAVGGRKGAMRAPALLAAVDYHGHPVAVTEPLPMDVTGARSKRTAPPTPEEMFALCPVHRHAALGDSGHLRHLVDRLRAMATEPLVSTVVEAGLELADAVSHLPGEVAMTERWHGDLTPWNRARQRDGQLWVWDWESSEADAVAGLDALHWAFSVRRPTSGQNTSVELADCLVDAGIHLRAAGVPRARWGDVAAVYALTVIERAAALAVRSESWDRLWIGARDLEELARQARSGLTG
ncbi:conserved hypothetical protein [metagenome]|uniref:Aminoglycoside phosphotransferase domain-containing protein n=1 Tax=metagenome TaxID=256318 RepID=A0A2P2BZE1_9ZZZZ